MCWCSGMASSLTRRASCPSPWLSLVCKIPIALLGFLETNTIGYISCELLNLSYFVTRKICQKYGVTPRCGRAHRLQGRAPLRGLLVPMDTIFHLLHTTSD